MKNLLLIAAGGALLVGCVSSGSGPADGAAVEAVRRYIAAGDRQDAALFRNVSHEKLQIVAVDYPAAGKVAVMSRELFGSLLEGGKLGGEPRAVEVQGVHALGASSVRVDLKMKSSKLAFENQFTVIKTENGWKVIQDLAHAIPLGE